QDKPHCSASTKSGKREDINMKTQRDGTRNGGTTSKSRRDGIQSWWPNTATGLGRPRRNAATATEPRPTVARRRRGSRLDHRRAAYTSQTIANVIVSRPR